MRLIGHYDPNELWGKSYATAAPASPWIDAKPADPIELVAAQLGRVPKTQRLRCWMRDYKSSCNLGSHDYGKARAKHVKAIVILNKSKDILDVLAMPRAWRLLPETNTNNGMRVLVLHTDPDVCREERKLQSKLSDTLLSVIRSLGRSPWRPADTAAAMPPSAAVQKTAKWSKPEAKITILYEYTKGVSKMKPAVHSFEDT